MKLNMVQLHDAVPAGSVGNNTSRLTSDEGSGPSHGWDLEADYDKRVVFATKGDDRLIVPFENAPYMRPAKAPVKVAKAKDAA